MDFIFCNHGFNFNRGVQMTEEKFVCRNCEKEFEESDAEDCEQFCCATCEGEYGTDIDSDEKAEWFKNKKDDADMEIALQEHFEKKHGVE